MRAFHCAWWAFFIAFFIWFAIGPLLPEIRDDLNITNEDLWTSSVAGVSTTIVVRIMVGPLCDQYGARVVFAFLLCTAAIPAACTGLIQSARDLIILRSCIGVAGGTFVACEYWTSVMFTREVAGTANALVAGWGNLGAGVTQIVIGSLLLPLFRVICGSSEQAWRIVSIVPAVIAFVTGILVYRNSDDCPKGNYSELKRCGTIKHISFWESLWNGAFNINTLILAIQYACCFGVELTMINAAALYFTDEFGQSTQSAAAIASIFGWMNLFARGVGGFWSDYGYVTKGMKGRLRIHFWMLVGEGIMVLIFYRTGTLAGSVIVMIVFSLFVQAAEGTTYGIVPYVDRAYVGSVSGIVGAGGNVGAAAFGLAFRNLNYETAFLIMGASIFGSSLLTIFIHIEGESVVWTSTRATDAEDAQEDEVLLDMEKK
jgi:NNP family nitrate/nitrite transporter-like MFS transporter